MVRSLAVLGLVACTVPAAAFAPSLARPPSARRLRSTAGDGNGDGAPLTWQDMAGLALSPLTPMGEKLTMAQQLAARADEVAADVVAAATNNDPESLLPPAVRPGAEAFRRQLTEDIVPSLADVLPGAAAAAARGAPARARGLASTAAAAFAAGTLPTVEDVREELNAVVSGAPPASLEQPPFTEEAALEGGACVRTYGAYAVASTALADGTSGAPLDELLGSAAAFDALAGYVLGGENDEQLPLGMTTPVAVEYAPGTGARASMAFSLPSRYSAATAPPPTRRDEVAVTDRGERLVAALKFGGVATPTQVRLTLADLEAAVAAAPAFELDAGQDWGHAVLQYNPPTTLPWLRRNEVLVPVARVDVDAAVAEVVEVAEAMVEADDYDDGCPSD